MATLMQYTCLVLFLIGLACTKHIPTSEDTYRKLPVNTDVFNKLRTNSKYMTGEENLKNGRSEPYIIRHRDNATNKIINDIYNEDDWEMIKDDSPLQEIIIWDTAGTKTHRPDPWHMSQNHMDTTLASIRNLKSELETNHFSSQEINVLRERLEKAKTEIEELENIMTEKLASSHRRQKRYMANAWSQLWSDDGESEPTVAIGVYLLRLKGDRCHYSCEYEVCYRVAVPESQRDMYSDEELEQMYPYTDCVNMIYGKEGYLMMMPVEGATEYEVRTCFTKVHLRTIMSEDRYCNYKRVISTAEPVEEVATTQAPVVTTKAPAEVTTAGKSQDTSAGKDQTTAAPSGKDMTTKAKESVTTAAPGGKDMTTKAKDSVTTAAPGGKEVTTKGQVKVTTVATGDGGDIFEGDGDNNGKEVTTVATGDGGDIFEGDGEDDGKGGDIPDRDDEDTGDKDKEDDENTRFEDIIDDNDNDVGGDRDSDTETTTTSSIVCPVCTCDTSASSP